jgi:hypothetical protein
MSPHKKFSSPAPQQPIDNVLLACKLPATGKSLMEQRIIEFVAAETGVRAEKISLSTSLFSDLGVAGDDGYDLIQNFARTFSVDITGVDSSLYFGGEGANPLMLVIKKLRPKILPLTVEDLVKIAERKVWIV